MWSHSRLQQVFYSVRQYVPLFWKRQEEVQKFLDGFKNAWPGVRGEMYGIAIVRLFLNKTRRYGVHVNFDSALMFAIVHRYEKMLKFMLKSGVPPSNSVMCHHYVQAYATPKIAFMWKRAGGKVPPRKPNTVPKPLEQCKDVQFKVSWAGDPLVNATILEKWFDDIKECNFDRNIENLYLHTTRNKDSNWFTVFAIRGERCIAAAACRLDGKLVEIHYLCSAKTCRGAGTMVVQEVERIARTKGCERVVLRSVRSAVKFYNHKVKFSRVSNNKSVTTRKSWANGPMLFEKRL